MHTGKRSIDRSKSPARLSRRALVVSFGSSAAGLLVAAVAGCQPALPSALPTNTSQPTVAPAPTSAPAVARPTPTAAPTSPTVVVTRPTSVATSPAAPTLAPAASPAAIAPTPGAKVSGAADLAVVKGASPADITRAAIDAIGGISRFVPKGATVLVKPNVCNATAPEYAVCTNPEVVETIIKMCREAGAGKVKVFDYGWGSTWNVAFKISGLEEVVKRAGGELVPVQPMKWKKVENPRAKLAKQLSIYEDVLSADVLINVPIAKHHGDTRLTLAMKNLMGVIQERQPFHYRSPIGQNLADLALVVKPTFTVLDAVRILVRNGPSGGSLDDVKKLDTVVAGTDMVAIDAFGSTLFGQQPDYLETVAIGEKSGIGTADLSKLKIAEVKR